MKNIVRRTNTFVQKIAKAGCVGAKLAELTRDTVRGILSNNSVHLSEIGRALNEPGPLMNTEKRLSREMANDKLDDEALRRGYLKLVAPTLKNCEFIGVDLTDYRKPYGRAFESLDQVRDASSKRKDIEPGYWGVQIEATTASHENIPLDLVPFSTKDPEYCGWFETIEASIRRVAPYVPLEATWLFDRGFDDIKMMQLLNELNRSWLIRQMQNRNIVVAEQKMLMKDLVHTLRTPLRTEVPYVDFYTHEPKLATVRFNFAPVEVPDLARPCTLLVIDGGGQEPIVLLTNRKVTSERRAARLVKAYFRRWGVEEGTRFMKQKFHLEDFRVRNWTSIRRMVLMAMLAYGFLALMIHRAPKAAQCLIDRVKVFIPHVLFPYYRLLDAVTAAMRTTR